MYLLLGFNDNHNRREFWEGLRLIPDKNKMTWLLLGDFNALSSTDDKVVVGRQYTWNNK